MGIIKEYKKFAVKGNVLDMAVGIVIGIALHNHRRFYGSRSNAIHPYIARSVFNSH